MPGKFGIGWVGDSASAYSGSSRRPRITMYPRITTPPRTSAPPKARAIPIGDVPPPEDPPPLLSVPAAAATVPSRLGPAYVGSAGSVAGSIAESVGVGLVPLDLLGLGDTLGDGLPDGSGFSITKTLPPRMRPLSSVALTLCGPGLRSSLGGLNVASATQLSSLFAPTWWPSHLKITLKRGQAAPNAPLHWNSALIVALPGPN